MKKYEVVRDEHEFVFEEHCPYCGADMTYVAQGWEKDKDEEGVWKASSLHGVCHNAPDIEDYEKKWQAWYNHHSDLPYEHWIPAEQKALEVINNKYRFKD